MIHPRPQPSSQRGAGQRQQTRQLDGLPGAAAGAGALLGAWEVAPDGCAVTDSIGRHVATAANPRGGPLDHGNAAACHARLYR